VKKTILISDDDEDDSFLAKDALETIGAMVAFSRVEDGMELMDYLSKRSYSGDRRLPDLILLDLNMPRILLAIVM
jgi:CheY-like chemotaxis protein